MECLVNIVGVSASANACIPAASTTSKSGLFLDDPSAGFFPVKEAFWANLGDVTRIVPTGVKDALNMVRIATEKRLRRTAHAVTTTIGFKDNYTSQIDVASDGVRFLVLKPKGVRGGMIRINSIAAYLVGGAYAGEFTVYKGSTEITGFTLPYIGLFDEPYYITYQVASDTTNNKPKNFKHTGCCGSTPTYTGYAWVGSGEVDDAANLQWVNSDYTMGIEVKAAFDCDGFQFMCDYDYVNTRFGVAFAKLVQQVCRRNMIMYALASDNITPYILAREEQILAVKEYLDKDIEELVNYEPEVYDHSDCYQCNGMYRGEILV